MTYRRPDAVIAYGAAVARQTRMLDTLLVVDNDPGESAKEAVGRFDLPGTAVDYVASGDNLGPAGGMALGMRRVVPAAGPDDWLVLLDDDDPPRTAEMLDALERFASRLRSADPAVAGVGLCGSLFDIRRARFVRQADEKLYGPVRVDSIGGNQLPFYSVSAVAATGTFDERLFFGFEELEWGQQLAAKGFTLYAHGDLWRREREAHGRVGLELTASRVLAEPDWRRYYSVRNMAYLLGKHGHRGAALRYGGLQLAKIAYNLPRNPGLALRSLDLVRRALTDAYRGRMGRTVEPRPKA